MQGIVLMQSLTKQKAKSCGALDSIYRLDEEGNRALVLIYSPHDSSLVAMYVLMIPSQLVKQSDECRHRSCNLN